MGINPFAQVDKDRLNGVCCIIAFNDSPAITINFIGGWQFEEHILHEEPVGRGQWRYAITTTSGKGQTIIIPRSLGSHQMFASQTLAIYNNKDEQTQSFEGTEFRELHRSNSSPQDEDTTIQEPCFAWFTSMSHFLPAGSTNPVLPRVNRPTSFIRVDTLANGEQRVFLIQGDTIIKIGSGGTPAPIQMIWTNAQKEIHYSNKHSMEFNLTREPDGGYRGKDPYQHIMIYPLQA